MVAASQNNIWAQYMRTRSVEDRNRLVLLLMPLVPPTAKWMFTRLGGAVEFEELENAGYHGLIQAIERYDPASNRAAFKTFSSRRITGAMLDVARQNDCLPVLLRGFETRRTEVLHDLTAELNRAPSQSEQADRLGISVERYQALDLKIRTFSRCSIESFLSYVFSEGDDSISRTDDVLDVQYYLQDLDDRSRLAVTLHYGEGFTKVEVGRKIGVHAVTVSRILSDALSFIRARGMI